MARPLLALSFAALFSAAATAGTLPVIKRGVEQSTPKYLVSANLNKLVFWHVPSRNDAAKAR